MLAGVSKPNAINTAPSAHPLARMSAPFDDIGSAFFRSW